MKMTEERLRNLYDKEEILFIVAERMEDDAKDAIEDCLNNPNNDFYKGVKHAYWCMLDTLKNQLDLHELSLMDVDVEINPDVLVK